MTLYSMEWLTADMLAKSVKVGDLIEFRRTMPYRHWAVCVEVNGEPALRTASNIKVIHLRPQFFGLSSGYIAYLFGHRGQIVIQLLSNMHHGKPCRINNVMDQRYVPLESGSITQLAVKKEGSSPYNIYYCNGEHFANSCRYGRHETLEENFSPLFVLFFLLVVVAFVPTTITFGVLAGVFVFVVLCMCAQKFKQSQHQVISITDPTSVPQPKTIE